MLIIFYMTVHQEHTDTDVQKWYIVNPSGAYGAMGPSFRTSGHWQVLARRLLEYVLVGSPVPDQIEKIIGSLKENTKIKSFIFIHF
jgi:hypothetical protein